MSPILRWYCIVNVRLLQYQSSKWKQHQHRISINSFNKLIYFREECKSYLYIIWLRLIFYCLNIGPSEFGLINALYPINVFVQNLIRPRQIRNTYARIDRRCVWIASISRSINHGESATWWASHFFIHSLNSSNRLFTGLSRKFDLICYYGSPLRAIVSIFPSNAQTACSDWDCRNNNCERKREKNFNERI